MSTHHVEANHEPTYPFAVEALTKRFEGALSGDDILSAVEQARGEIEPGATVHDFLGLLIERRARDILTVRSRKTTRTL